MSSSRIIKLVGATVAALAMLLGVAASSYAAGGVVGTFSIADRGQGCWAGGNLLPDGSANGHGGCAFTTPVGEEVASITPQSWSFTDSTHTAVNLCATFVGKKGPVFPVGVPVTNCVAVPVGTGAPVNLFEDTYGKVTLVNN